MSERRRFARILFVTQAHLRQGEHSWQTQLVDLSLLGALLIRPDDWANSGNKEYQLSVVLSESDIKITMQVELTHAAGNKLGFYCHHIDIDSATHLKRIVELNLGDEKLLQRELAQLLNDHLEHHHP